MKPFDYERATDPRAAVSLVASRPGAMFLGAGTNLVDHMRLGIAHPDLLVDVTRLGYDSIERLPDGGVRIGAGVRNSDLAADPLIRQHYPVVAAALLAGASGQLRNLATTGGNLLQRTRCAYFQDPTVPCNKRSPGEGCAAIEGFNRDHAILGASAACVATHPSDLSVALTALDARVRVLGQSGERAIPIDEFYRLPGDRPDRDTVLDHGELITAVDLPDLPIAARSVYRKVRDRASYAFALVSVAAAVEVADGVDGGVIKDVRIAFGGIAHKPWRAWLAEDGLRGRPATEHAFRAAATAELAGAQPLAHNGFKVPLAANTLVAVLRELTRDSGTGGPPNGPQPNATGPSATGPDPRGPDLTGPRQAGPDLAGPSLPGPDSPERP
jgi:xanthine dehydrogenase YagS FAD-binding subunit